MGAGRELYGMPERIDASPEDIARVFMNAKLKTNWRYIEEAAKSGKRT